MNANLPTVAAWSYGLAAIGYAAYWLYLVFASRGGVRSVAFLLAVGLTAVWALVASAFALTEAKLLYEGAALVDALRVGAWYGFLLLLTHPEVDGVPLRRPSWLVPVAAALVTMGVAVQAGVVLHPAFLPELLRLAIFDGIALSVLGLVLVEQLFRNAPEDERWSV